MAAYHLQFGDVYAQKPTNVKAVADWRTSTNEAWLVAQGKTAVTRHAQMEVEERLRIKHGMVINMG